MTDVQCFQVWYGENIGRILVIQTVAGIDAQTKLVREIRSGSELLHLSRNDFGHLAVGILSGVEFNKLCTSIRRRPSIHSIPSCRPKKFDRCLTTISTAI